MRALTLKSVMCERTRARREITHSNMTHFSRLSPLQVVESLLRSVIVRKGLKDALAGDQQSIVFGARKSSESCDYLSHVAVQMAASRASTAQVLAEELAADVRSADGIERCVVDTKGKLEMRFDDRWLAERAVAASSTSGSLLTAASTRMNVLVDYGSPNVGKDLVSRVG
jgi:arginyl-tRNA synthetase